MLALLMTLAAWTSAATPPERLGGIPLPVDKIVEGVRAGLKESRRAGAVNNALVRMSAADPDLARLAGLIERRAIRIVYREQAEASLLVETDGESPEIRLREDVPQSPEVLGILLARESSRVLYEDMFESAEKEYLRLGLQGKAWLALGGDRTNPPSVGPLSGYARKDLAEELRLWAENSPEAVLPPLAEMHFTHPLSSMESQVRGEIVQRPAGDHVREILEQVLVELEREQALFKTSLESEREWRRARGLPR